MTKISSIYLLTADIGPEWAIFSIIC